MKMSNSNINRALALGISYSDLLALQKLSRSLSSWHERLCNDTQEDDNGKCWRYHNGENPVRTPNRGPGLERRIAAILLGYTPVLSFFIQQDPRGAALYVANNPLDDNNYSSGVAIY